MPSTVLHGHNLLLLREMPAKSVHCAITSSPYWGLRSYETEPQIWGGSPDCVHKDGFSESDNTCRHCKARGEHGLEPSMQMWLAHELAVFAEVHRVLRDDGTLWVNLGDTYATTPNGTAAAAAKAKGNDDRTFRDKPFSTASAEIPAKNRLMLPARLAIALQEAGWWLRDELVWSKKNPLPSSVRDRTTPSHEMVYLFAKQPSYYFDDIAIEEPCSPNTRPGRTDGRTVHAVDGGHGFDRRVNSLVRTYTSETRRKRSVWQLANEPFPGAHFATFPTALVEPMILASTSAAGVCPQCGAPHRRLRAPRRPRSSDRAVLQPKLIPNSWAPSCSCAPHRPIPATVLDPFGGSGTVGVVANRLNRDSILLELNPSYVSIARQRLLDDHQTPEIPKREKRRRQEFSSVDRTRASGEIA